MKRFRLVLCGCILVWLTPISQSAVSDKLKSKSGYNKAMTQLALRTVGKQTLKNFNVAAKTFNVTYSATRVAVNLPQFYDAADNMINGILNGRCWAVAMAEVECTGITPQSDIGLNSASASSSESCWWHGSAATSMVTVSRAANAVIVTGTDKSVTGSADWYGLGGVGNNIKVGSSLLGKLGAIIQDLCLDPPLPGEIDEPIIDPELSNSMLVSLFQPAGFAMTARVYYPSAIPGDPAAPLFYDAEITGFLAINDENADLPQDAFGVQLFTAGEYYDRLGNSLGTVTGSAVTNLTSSDFTYHEYDVDVDGNSLPAFGFDLSNFQLEMPLDLPSDWSDLYPDQYIHVDFDVLAGGAAAGVPEPITLYFASIGGLAIFRIRRRHNKRR